MKLPKKVVEYVNSTNVFNGMDYVEFLDTLNGKICTRLFAYKHTKTYGVECKEIFREFMSGNYVSGSLWFGGACGYQVCWGRSKVNSYAYFQNKKPDDKFYKTVDKFWRPNVHVTKLYTNKQAIALLSKEVPYFYISEDTYIYDLMCYARLYKEKPQLEMLAKNGFSYLYVEKRLFNLGVAKSKEVYKWLRENKQFTTENKPCYNFIKEAMKLGYSGEELQEHNEIIEIQKSLELTLLVNWTMGRELNKYLKRQQCSVDIYRDYLNASKKLGRNIEDRGVQFPRNLMEQHDQVVKAVADKESKGVNRKLKKVYKVLEKYGYKRNGLQIVIPKTQGELVEWGNKLHNCVGTMGYGKSMAMVNVLFLEYSRTENLLNVVNFN